MSQIELNERFYNFVVKHDINNANLCLELGADIDTIYYGTPVLFRCFFHSDYDLFEFLITKGANPLLKNDFFENNIFEFISVHDQHNNSNNFFYKKVFSFLSKYKTQKTMIEFHPGCYIELHKTNLLNSSIKEEYHYLMACNELNLL